MKTEWDLFIHSKTVKAVVALVLVSLEERIRDPSTISWRQWFSIVAASTVVLLIRHTLAGIEAKVE